MLKIFPVHRCQVKPFVQAISYVVRRYKSAILPLQFHDGENAATYRLTGEEKYSIEGIAELQPRQDVEVKVTRDSGEELSFTARCRIDTYNELEYFRSGGILQYVLRRLAAA